MPSKYEYYEPSTIVKGYVAYQTRQQMQSFLVGPDSHTITSVKFKWNKAVDANTIGTVNVDLYAVDGDGKPTGSSLMAGTYNGNTLSADPTVDTIEVTFGSPYTVSSGTSYVWVITAENTTSGNNLNAFVETSGGYSDGSWGYRDWGGSSYGAWNLLGRDMWFQNYGDYVAPPAFKGSRGFIF